MAAAESLTLVRTRIGRHIAAAETRAARLKPVDIGARMAAIRIMAAKHGVAPR